jgi:hypothetical protein
MSYNISVIKSDGAVIRTRQDKQPNLEQLQAAVGGDIQPVPHFRKFENHVGVAYADEDGQMKNLPLNMLATTMWLQNLGKGPFSYPPRLFGNVVFINREK